MFNGKIYDQIKSGNFDFDHGKIREKSGNFISLSEWEPCKLDIYALFEFIMAVDQ